MYPNLIKIRCRVRRRLYIRSLVIGIISCCRLSLHLTNSHRRSRSNPARWLEQPTNQKAPCKPHCKAHCPSLKIACLGFNNMTAWKAIRFEIKVKFTFWKSTVATKVWKGNWRGLNTTSENVNSDSHWQRRHRPEQYNHNIWVLPLTLQSLYRRWRTNATIKASESQRVVRLILESKRSLVWNVQFVFQENI